VSSPKATSSGYQGCRRCFLERWHGRHLRLVDKWGAGDAEADPADLASHLFYVDIANIHGKEIRSQHRVHCEARLADALRTGRAEIFNLDSAVAAAMLPDSSLDFVYLDARHDFAGVVDDIQAWWPKVKVGGVFAGHDFVEGEFPEGDFFWISGLQEVLPGVVRSAHVTQEKNRYPSFFIVKTEALASLTLQTSFDAEASARRFYAERSKYFALWQSFAERGDQAQAFLSACGEACAKDCSDRALQFTPTRSAASTLRPFACRANADDAGNPKQASAGEDAGAVDTCASELVVDVKAYSDVCLERCSVTCIQRSDLFAQFGTEILSV